MNEMKCSESALILSAFENRLRAGLTHHANKSSRWAEYKHKNGPRVRWTSPVEKEKVYLWRKGFAEKPSLKFRMNWQTERVREDASGDSEDGEDDEMHLGAWPEGGRGCMSHPSP